MSPAHRERSPGQSDARLAGFEGVDVIIEQVLDVAGISGGSDGGDCFHLGDLARGNDGGRSSQAVSDDEFGGAVGLSKPVRCGHEVGYRR